MTKIPLERAAMELSKYAFFALFFWIGFVLLFNNGGDRRLYILIVACILLSGILTFAKWPARKRLVPALGAIAVVAIVFANVRAFPPASATFFSEKYVGRQLAAGEVLQDMAGARLVYGRDGLQMFRILTDTAFLKALRISGMADGGSAGVDLHLDEDQFRSLSERPSRELWYGGYHFRFYSGGEPAGIFVLVLPPGEPYNLGLIVAEDLYQRIVHP
jgi:hypothetical protein